MLRIITKNPAAINSYIRLDTLAICSSPKMTPLLIIRNAPKTLSPPDVDVFLTDNGGHMGFLGWSDPENRYFWLDHQLLEWIASI